MRKMNLIGFVRNVVFALVFFVIAASISYVDLPLTNRMEEYIAFVLTTDFDVEAWIAKAEQTRVWSDLSQWWAWIPWLDHDTSEAIPVGPSAPTQ